MSAPILCVIAWEPSLPYTQKRHETHENMAFYSWVFITAYLQVVRETSNAFIFQMKCPYPVE